MPDILLIDDEVNMLKSLSAVLQRKGYRVRCAETAERGLRLLDEQSPDLVITDLKLPDMDGVTVLRQLREKMELLPVIIITGHGTMESAIEAVNLGAFSYVLKPIEMASFLVAVARAVEHGQLLAENMYLHRELEEQFRPESIVGHSRPMQEVFELIKKVAKTRHTVLICGESGTGKELVARAIHYASARAKGKIVAVNCGSLPESLLESELFGHERGSFTGATERKIGLFETASGGTIFLDEIGDLTLETQSKLLRVLQEREVQPVGSVKTKIVDIRVLAATNKDLKEEMAAGRFREDLYYRIKVIAIVLPPLRDRREDVPLLAEHFMRKSGWEDGQISSKAMALLTDYSWPGNVRELENVVKRAITLSDGHVIQPDSLPQDVTGALPIQEAPGEDEWSFKDARHRWERYFLERLLDRHAGNVSAAARHARLSRRHLYEKLSQHGMSGLGQDERVGSG